MSLPDGMPHPFVPSKGLYETPPLRGGDLRYRYSNPCNEALHSFPIDCHIIAHSRTEGKISIPVAINRFPEETQFAVVATYPEHPSATECCSAWNLLVRRLVKSSCILEHLQPHRKAGRLGDSAG